MTDWKNKLLAFLHDPPHKPFQIAGHEDQRASFLRLLNLSVDELRAEFQRGDDWNAAAADRLIFPDPKPSRVRTDWQLADLEFRHPLGGGRLTPRSFPSTGHVAESWVTEALSGVAQRSADPRSKFVSAWRLWPERCAREKHPSLAYLVADTRIPDHTLWHHNALSAAFSTAGARPAFLLFQIGPVQDFIKQARKTQDLWAGSYLLSFLIAQAQIAIADAIGPDSIIYPQLRGLPLADWHWFKQGVLPAPLRASHPHELLTPNLPNRFLALVPADWRDEQGRSLAQLAETAVRDTWSEIACSVRKFIEREVGKDFPGWDAHWDDQVGRFPVIEWALHEWADTESAIREAAAEKEPMPPLHGGWPNHPLHHAEQWARKMIPAEHRESWANRPTKGFAWSLHYAVTDWKFAAKKNARSAAAWIPHARSATHDQPKDHLDGRNETLGNEAFWQALRKKLPTDFKGSQLYGALTVIKRLYPKAYLGETLGWEPWKPKFDSVPELAQIDKAIDDDDDAAETYYAILAMDGDDMGHWVSGLKTPKLHEAVSATGSVEHPEKSPRAYLKAHWKPEQVGGLSWDQVQRPLSPGYHAALSEALANFGLYCAGQIVREFGGQLIYAGGDDVLAMLPAARALDCAQALQLAFRGLAPDKPEARASREVQRVLNQLFEFPADGFIRCKLGKGRGEHTRPNWPLLVMGSKATASVGIAIGHVRSPMQDTIQAARDAETAAKRLPDKGAFCLSVLKRSGEAATVTAKWNSGVAGVWEELSLGVHDQSNRFAYRYLQLIRPLLASTGKNNAEGWVSEWSSPLRDAVEAELRHVLKKQAGQEPPDAASNASRWIFELIGADLSRPALTPRDFVHFWMAWAFVNRLTKP